MSRMATDGAAAGTTYSCVANYEGTNVEISALCRVLFPRLSSSADDFHAVANEQGSFTTPSFVSFTDEERLIGEAAKNQAAMNPANTIFDIKYVMIDKRESSRNLSDLS